MQPSTYCYLNPASGWRTILAVEVGSRADLAAAAASDKMSLLLLILGTWTDGEMCRCLLLPIDIVEWLLTCNVWMGHDVRLALNLELWMYHESVEETHRFCACAIAGCKQAQGYRDKRTGPRFITS